MKVTKKLTEGNVYKNMLFYAIPLILSSLLSQAFSTVDGVIAGRFISEHALGAIGATSSFETLLRSVFSGFCSGFSIYVAQLFGKGNYAAVKRDTVSVVSFIAIVSALIGCAVIAFRDPIMDYLRVDEILREDAEIYFVIYTSGYAVYYANSCLVNVLHAMGITSFSLVVTFVSAVLNIGGNLFAVLVLDAGVAGLAAVTVISSLSATAIYLTVLIKAFHEMDSGKTTLRPSLEGVRGSLGYSITTAVQQLAFHGVGFLIAPMINGLGASASTGYSVANRLYSFGTMAMWAATSAFACYAGQCVGEGNIKKMKEGLRTGFAINSLLILPFVAVIIIFAHPIVSLFFPSEYGGEAFGFAVRYAQVYLPFIYVQLVGHMFHSYMRSLGKINTVFAVSLVGSITRYAATYFLIPHLSVEGVYLGQIVGWTIDALICIIIFICFYCKEYQLMRIIQRIHKKNIGEK